ncbi:MAG TPA: PadR family transcriptional regulator [Gemmatimonadaceae bacterium]|nr:PadR family transcriptional regulator [Gemmatimonadaceae bacterium]
MSWVELLHVTLYPRGGVVPKSTGPSKSELLKGTLDMLILQTLTTQPLHGYAIAQQIELLSDAVLTVEQGSLYPALERLQKRGWVTSKWGESPTGRRARYYTLTATGRRQLGEEISDFDRVLVAINRVMRRA